MARVKIDAGSVVVFRATKLNSGPMTINGKVLHLKRDGTHLSTADIPAGAEIEVDLETGEVLRVEGGDERDA